MNPIGAPVPSGDSGRIVRGIFVLPASAHERTHGCSPRAPGQFESNRLGDVYEFVNKGCFSVLSTGARERTRGCSPRAPGQFGQNHLGFFLCCQWGRIHFVSGCARAHPWVWPSSPRVIQAGLPRGFVSGRVCAFFSRDRVVNQGIVLQPRWFGFWVVF